MSKRNARKLVIPPMTLPNMMPIKGTITGSFMGIRKINHTKTQVPAIAARNANAARDQRLESGKKSSAMRIPNCAEEIVAPVVGETNLLAQSCCMMSPAMLIPTPVHRTAASRGRREARSTCSASASPVRTAASEMSAAPAVSDARPAASVSARRIQVDLVMPVRKKIDGLCEKRKDFNRDSK